MEVININKPNNLCRSVYMHIFHMYTYNHGFDLCIHICTHIHNQQDIKLLEKSYLNSLAAKCLSVLNKRCPYKQIPYFSCHDVLFYYRG